MSDKKKTQVEVLPVVDLCKKMVNDIFFVGDATQVTGDVCTWADISYPTEARREKNNEKPTINMKNYVSVCTCTFSYWNSAWAGPSNPRAGPRNCRPGPYRARVSWASLSCDGPGRAGPRLLQK